MSGTAEAGATVTIYDGDTVLGTVVAGEDGRWSLTHLMRWTKAATA
ncbi:Ig-like domain-containing protein [Klebsiella oxytoca]|nr:Ig-like domain-containing protein [Klebsiella oxytoca]